jgi:hypothetical protein
VSRGAFPIRFWINARLAMVPNASQELSLKSAKLVKVKELLTSDKVQCKFKWAALLVEEKEQQITTHV